MLYLIVNNCFEIELTNCTMYELRVVLKALKGKDVKFKRIIKWF